MSNQTSIGGASSPPKKKRIFTEKKNFRTLLTKLNLVTHYLTSDWDLKKTAKVAGVKRLTLKKWVITYSAILIKLGIAEPPTAEFVADLPKRVRQKVGTGKCMWSPLPEDWTWEKTFEAADKFLYGNLEVYRDMCDHYEGINKDSSGLLVQLRRIYNASATGELLLYSGEAPIIAQCKDDPTLVIRGALMLSSEEQTSFHMGKRRPQSDTVRWDMFAAQLAQKAEKEAQRKAQQQAQQQESDVGFDVDDLLDSLTGDTPAKPSPIAKAAQRSRSLRVAPYNKDVGIADLMSMQKGYVVRQLPRAEGGGDVQVPTSPIHDEFVASLADSTVEAMENVAKKQANAYFPLRRERDTLQAELVKEVNIRKDLEVKLANEVKIRKHLEECREAQASIIQGHIDDMRKEKAIHLDKVGDLQAEIDSLRDQSDQLKKRLNMATIKMDTLKDLKGDKGLAEENKRLQDDINALRSLFGDLLGSAVSIHQILHSKK